MSKFDVVLYDRTFRLGRFFLQLSLTPALWCTPAFFSKGEPVMQWHIFAIQVTDLTKFSRMLSLVILGLRISFGYARKVNKNV